MFREIVDQKEWNELYSQASVASGKFLESWEWGKFQKTLGRKVFRFSDGIFLASVVELPMPFGKKFWFCPKGPIAANGMWQTASGFLEELIKEAKKAGAVYLRIEPTEAIHGFSAAAHAHDVSPRLTSIIDLSKSEDEIFAAMHQKTRYNVRVAEKHGVKVERYHNAAPLAEDLSRIFAETAARDRFYLHPFGYYLKQLEAFGEKKEVEGVRRGPHTLVFAARAGGKIIAAAIVMFDGEVATYLHGASSDEMRNTMAPYAAHAAVIRRAKERGYKRYDLWGISDDPRSGWAGITRFKRGWGGSEVSAPGTIDLPLSLFWYSVYRLARQVEGWRLYVVRKLKK